LLSWQVRDRSRILRNMVAITLLNMLYSVGCETCEASMDKQEKKETNWFSAQTERTNFN